MMYICITKTILLPPAMILKSEQIDRQVILCHNIVRLTVPLLNTVI
jgi:diacylglycerol kinase